MFIKNTTPYVGKLKLTFEKEPEYTSSNPYSVLNTVHFDFGKFKLVSRMYPNRLTGTGYHEIDSEKIKLILQKTRGKIGVHEWWLCTNKNTGYNKTKYTEPDPKIWKILDHNILEESFVSQKEHYIGDIQDAWWYVQNNFEVCEDYPGSVAREVDDNRATTGFYGYTHRGGALFQKGDKIFDGNYKPKEKDYPNWQWAGWKREWDEAYEKGDEFDRKWLDEDGIGSYIPFRLRGKKTIETWDDAKLSARNLSKYL